MFVFIGIYIVILIVIDEFGNEVEVVIFIVEVSD